MPYGAHQGGKKPEKGMQKKQGKKLAGTAYAKPEKPMKPRKSPRSSYEYMEQPLT